MTTSVPPGPYVTLVPWRASLQHPQYGTADTYRLAATWLQHCPTVADWGGSTGFFGTCLPASVQYTIVDGTQQVAGQVLADLATYQEPSDGILLRHVLDATPEWDVVLRNALAACRQRLVVVTHTPPAAETAIVHVKSGWPIWHFNPADLRAIMGTWLVSDEAVITSHPEHVYYLERPR